MGIYKKVILFFAFSLFSLSIFPYVYKNLEKSVFDSIYKKQILEDFESRWNGIIKLPLISDARYSVSIGKIFPAPILNSRGYLRIRLENIYNDAVQIIFNSPIRIKDYCDKISLWFYNRSLSGRLFLVFQDVVGNVTVIRSNVIDHKGWRQLFFRLTGRVRQGDLRFGVSRPIRFIKIIYIPQSAGVISWTEIGLDDIVAYVRKKYLYPKSVFIK